MSEIIDRRQGVKNGRHSGGKIEICKLEIKGYNTNIYSRHVQHELYNLLIHERGEGKREASQLETTSSYLRYVAH